MADSDSIKLCECGCGQPTNPARQTDYRLGYVKGEPMRFLKGHASRVVLCSKPRHGHSLDGRPTRTYRIWANMRSRCTNPLVPCFRNYGGRGITVCESWAQFENFLADMGECPAGHSIDRIDNDGNYEPGNCVWATKAVQSSNRRTNIRITHAGRTLTLKQWAVHLGKSYSALLSRFHRGWSTARILDS